MATRNSARPMQTKNAASNNHATRHEHRTAKVVELIGTSSKSFEDAVRNALKDAAATTRGISGAQVETYSVKCSEGKITEYKASLKVVFGIERT
jgi:flavin-binding protein dodecin